MKKYFNDSDNIIQFLEDGFLRADKKGYIIMANETIAEMCGYDSPEAMIGLHMKDIYANHGERDKMISKIRSCGKLLNYELELKRKDGSCFWSLSNIKILADEEGNLMGTEGVIHDISKRKQTEENLVHANKVLAAIRNVNQLIIRERDTAKLLQGICENLTENRGYLNVWIVLLDENGAFQSIYQCGFGNEFNQFKKELKNGNFCGCARQAMKQKDLVVITDPYRNCGDCLLSKKYKNRGGLTAPIIHDGRLFGLITASVPRKFLSQYDFDLFKEVADDIGLALQNILLGQSRDTAERNLQATNQQLRADNQQLVASQEELQAVNQLLNASNQQLKTQQIELEYKEELLSATGEMARVGGWELDIEANKITWSDETYRIHGLPPDYEPPLEEAINFFDPKDRPKLQGALKNAVEKGEAYDLVLRFISAKGKHLITRTICHPEMKDGQVKKLKGTFQDVTDWKQAEEKLQAANQQLQAANQQLSASEEELRAANQQLAASEEELRATNQQLAASEGELQAANQQLSASEQQLLAGNQQLCENQKELEAERDKAQRYLDVASVMFLVINEKGEVTLVNRKGAGILGYQPNEIIGKNWFDHFLPARSRNEIKSVFSSIIAGKITQFEYNENSVVAKDGSEKIIAWHNTILKDEQGRIIGSLSSGEDITDRKKAEEERRKSDERFRIAQDMSPDGFTILNPVRDEEGDVVDFTWVYENEAIAKLNGTDPEKVIGKRLLDLFPGHRDSQFLKAYKEVAESGKSKTFEEGYAGESMRKSIWFRIVVVPMGENIAVLAQDISEQKNAENDLKSSEAKFRSYVNNAPDGIFITDEKGKYVDVNPAATKITGWAKEELLNLSIPDLLQPDSVEAGIRGFQELAVKGSIKIDLGYVTKSGKHRYWEVAGVKLSDNRFLGFAKDITDRRKAEDALLKNQYYFTKAQEIGEIGTWELDLEKNELIWTEQNYKNFGIPPGTPLTYDKFLDCLHPEDRQFVNEEWMKALAGNPYDIEHRILVSGKERWLREKADITFDKEGNAIKAIGFAQDITKLKQSEEDLKESEKKYRNLFENLVDEVHLWKLIKHKNGKIKSWELVEANPSALNAWKKTRKEVLGKSTNEIFDNDSTKQFMPIVKKIFETGEPFYWESFFEPTDQYLSMVSIPMGDFFISTGRDITDMKKAEEALKHSQERLQNMFDLSPSIISRVNLLSGHFIEVNNAVARILGYSVEEFTSRPFMDFIHPDDRQGSTEEKNEQIKGKEVISYENRYLCKDGTYKWIAWFGTKADENGIVTAVGTDVTDRKEVEKEIIDVTQRLKISTESANIGIWDFNLQENILIWDKRMFELYGIKEEDFGGAYEAWKEGVHPDDVERSDAEVHDAIAGKKNFHTQFRVVWPTGQVRFIEAHAIVIRDPDGTPKNMIGVNWDITEKKKAEKELKESQNLLQKAEHISDQGSWKWDIINDRWSFSENWKKIHGCDQAGISKKELMEIAHPDDSAKINKAFEDALNNKKPYALEHRIIRKDNGAIRYIKAIGEVQFTTSGEPVFMIGVANDITEQKKAEEKLKSSEAKFRSYVDNAPIGIFISDENGKYLEVNPAASKITGYSRKELLNMSIPDLLQEKDIEKSMKNFNELVKKGSVQFDKGFVSKSGENRYWEIAAVKLSETRYLGFSKDITEQKEAEKELKKSEANIRAIIEGSNNSIWAFDRNYRILYINRVFQQEFLQSFGVKLEKGMSLVESLPDILQPIWKPRYTKVLANEKFKIEDAVPTDTGTIFIEVAFNPIIENNKVIGGSCIGSDITSRKNDELELIKAKELAEESDRLKSAFLSNMSHEIRTPMNGILGFADLLKAPDLKTEEQQKYISVIEKSGNRMLNIINDIIDISKIESGAMEVSIKEVDINNQLKYLFTFFKPEADSKGLDLTLRNTMPENMAKIETDGEKVSAVLVNLIKNAIKYTDKGAIEFGCEIVEFHQAAFLQFSVKDTGIGISKDRHEAIFERFVQADIDDVRARQGAGLGLSISKAYVGMLGGKLWLESQEENQLADKPGGTTFYFTIPQHFSDKNKHGAATKANVEDDIFNQNLKILVADDDIISSELITILLGGHIKEIVNAQTGKEVVELCRKHPDFDLILMDVRMPELNGYEATRQIRQFNNDIIIIAQTAYGLSGDRDKAMDAGCNDYISKPIKKSKLFELIQKYFEK